MTRNLATENIKGLKGTLMLKLFKEFQDQSKINIPYKKVWGKYRAAPKNHNQCTISPQENNQGLIKDH